MWPVPATITVDPRPRGNVQFLGGTVSGPVRPIHHQGQQHLSPPRAPLFLPEQPRPQPQQRPLTSRQFQASGIFGVVPGNDISTAQRHTIQSEHFQHHQQFSMHEHFGPSAFRQPQQSSLRQSLQQPPLPTQDLSPRQEGRSIRQPHLSQQASSVLGPHKRTALTRPPQVQRGGSGAWSGPLVAPPIIRQHQHEHQHQQEGAWQGPPTSPCVNVPLMAGSGSNTPVVLSPRKRVINRTSPRGGVRAPFADQVTQPQHYFHAQQPPPFYDQSVAPLYGPTMVTPHGETRAPSHNHAMNLANIPSCPRPLLDGPPALSMGPMPVPPGVGNGGRVKGCVFSNADYEPWGEWDMALAEALASDSQVGIGSCSNVVVQDCTCLQCCIYSIAHLRGM